MRPAEEIRAERHFILCNDWECDDRVGTDVIA
jgi:hypothetical protein